MNLESDLNVRFNQTTGKSLLSTLVLGKLPTLQKHLESRPKFRSSSEGAVHVNGTVREPGSNRLVDIND